MKEIVLLGPEGSGKTLILRRISELITGIIDANIDSTTQTIGVDVIKLTVNSTEVCFRSINILKLNVAVIALKLSIYLEKWVARCLQGGRCISQIVIA